jgi:hypothetical protein
MPARQRFFVDLKDGETTVVSWKKLTSDADKSMSSGAPSDAPVGANPALEARIAPDVQVNLFFLPGWRIFVLIFVFVSMCRRETRESETA